MESSYITRKKRGKAGGRRVFELMVGSSEKGWIAQPPKECTHRVCNEYGASYLRNQNF